jgi:hypothetical protein
LAKAEAKVAGNQVQVPVIQSQDPTMTQVQQNANKVFRNINNQVVDLQNQVSQMEIIGEIKFSPISLAQFQAIAGDTWILANGQSSVGTKYASLYGFNTVPTITVAGTNAFIKVNT